MVSINFKTEGDIKKWHIENDTVMGGVSTSKIGYLKEYGGVKGILFFQGDVSLKMTEDLLRYYMKMEY